MHAGGKGGACHRCSVESSSADYVKTVTCDGEEQKTAAGAFSLPTKTILTASD